MILKLKSQERVCLTQSMVNVGLEYSMALQFEDMLRGIPSTMKKSKQKTKIKNIGFLEKRLSIPTKSI
jgi:hypothetical protein